MKKEKNVILVPGAGGYVPCQEILEKELLTTANVFKPDFLRDKTIRMFSMRDCDRVFDDLATKTY